MKILGLIFLVLIAALVGSWQWTHQSVPEPVFIPYTQTTETIIGAGDIASSDSLDGARATAALINKISGTVITLGDNVYSYGKKEEFEKYYEPTWGQFKQRTRPSPGNHDYATGDAKAYFNYFGANAGPKNLGYYSYTLGAWQILSLNSNIDMTAQSDQAKWLRQELLAHPTKMHVSVLASSVV